MKIIQNRKKFYIFSSIMVLISLGLVASMGVRLGIDFTGGSLLEISYSTDRPSPDSINEILKDQGVESVQIQAVAEDGYLLRMPHMEEQMRRDIVAALRASIGDDGSKTETSLQVKDAGENMLGGDIGIGLTFEGEDGEEEILAVNKLTEDRFETIGPVIGEEMKSKSIQALIVVLVAILLYIAWAFRKVSWPVQSWKYGLVALITLFHDVVIVFGVYTWLTHLYGWELNTAFVAAILTILGYSVNDTIVVFDRIRENVPRLSGTFEEVVNTSVNQTISRSLITSLTTLFVLVSVLVIGGTTIQSFVAALSMGVVIGTYSSIFIASPLLVTAQLRGKQK